MKRSCNSLIGFSIAATDGEMGTVTDFYFDDESWTVRYLVVETGSWLIGRKVLISPQAIASAGWDTKTFHLNLTKQQVKNSPDIDTDKPVSRQHEVALNRYYPWNDYWTGSFWAGGMGMPVLLPPAPQDNEDVEDVKNGEQRGDPHLRSVKKVTGYTVKATDGDIGEVEDFLVDEISLKIAFLIVDTGNWFQGKKVVLSPDWLRQIDWIASEVTVAATAEQVKSSPAYDAAEPLTDGRAEAIQKHYGQPQGPQK